MVTRSAGLPDERNCVSLADEVDQYGLPVAYVHYNLFENDKKLIAAAGLDPTVFESGKYKGQSKISKRGNRHLRRTIWLMTMKTIVSAAWE